MKVLDLVLKRQWYDMIDSGEKKEEYRRINQYWINRFCGKENQIKHFDFVKFHRGYTNKTTMVFVVDNFTIGQGNTDWGAPENEETFIIKLGERITK
jgi:hypothetical protein